MWWLIALRGLRLGEAIGLRWVDVDLDAGVAMIEQQRIANGHLVTVGPPGLRAAGDYRYRDRRSRMIAHGLRAWASGVDRYAAPDDH
jgi:integrase